MIHKHKASRVILHSISATLEPFLILPPSPLCDSEWRVKGTGFQTLHLRLQKHLVSQSINEVKRLVSGDTAGWRIQEHKMQLLCFAWRIKKKSLDPERSLRNPKSADPPAAGCEAEVETDRDRLRLFVTVPMMRVHDKCHALQNHSWEEPCGCFWTLVNSGCKNGRRQWKAKPTRKCFAGLPEGFFLEEKEPKKVCGVNPAGNPVRAWSALMKHTLDTVSVWTC